MHPYLFPWTLSADVLTVLAYVLVVVAGGVFAWVAYTRGDDTPMGTYGWPAVALAGTIGVGIWIIRTQLGEITPQPLPLHTYGLMIALGFVSGIHLAGRESARTASVNPAAFYTDARAKQVLADAEKAVADARSKGKTPVPADELVGRSAKERFFDLSFWILVWSMVGSRVLFIIVNWGGPDGYGAHPDKIFKVWTGGLVFYGGFIGAALAAVWYARKNGVNFRALSDIAIPVVALGHFFGRMGCIAAGCCWGKVCHDASYFLGMHYPRGALAYGDMVKDPQWRAFILENGVTPAVHPTPLYEGVGELCLFLLLTWLRPKKRFHGQILATWLTLYALLRLTIETFRGDWGRGMLFKWPDEIDPILLSTSQVIGVAMLGLGITLFFLWRPKSLPRVESKGDAAGTAAATA